MKQYSNYTENDPSRIGWKDLINNNPVDKGIGISEDINLQNEIYFNSSS